MRNIGIPQECGTRFQSLVENRDESALYAGLKVENSVENVED